MNLVLAFSCSGVAAIHFGAPPTKRRWTASSAHGAFPGGRSFPLSIAASYAALIIYTAIPVPGTLGGTFSYLGAMTTSLSMMILGVNLAAMPLRQVFGNGKTYVMSCAIVTPACAYWLFRLLLGGCGIGIPLRVVIFLSGHALRVHQHAGACRGGGTARGGAALQSARRNWCPPCFRSNLTIPLLYALTEWLGGVRRILRCSKFRRFPAEFFALRGSAEFPARGAYCIAETKGGDDGFCTKEMGRAGLRRGWRRHFSPRLQAAAARARCRQRRKKQGRRTRRTRRAR